MPCIPAERAGEPLSVKGAEVEFSYFPTVNTSRRDKLQTKFFTTDAWSIIHSTVRRVRPLGFDYETYALDFSQNLFDLKTPVI